jgi:molecular chaperone DnaK
MTREKLFEICEPVLKKLLKPMNEALEIARLDRSDIEEIIMVGGSSRLL